MMRGPYRQAIAVRDQDGKIVMKEEELKFIKDKYPILGWPLIRGVVNFGGSMVAGVKALMYSASFYPEEEDVGEPGKFETWLEKHIGSEKMESLVIYLAVLLGAACSVGLFLLLPTFLVGLVKPIHDHYLLRNLCEGVVKLAILLVYMIGISKLKDMRRVFSYHGAEHKTIKCYELGKELTVENVRPLHPVPSPLRHQLFICGDFHQHSGGQRGAGGQYPAADAVPSAAAVSGGFYQLRAQPAGGTARQSPDENPYGAGPLAPELYHQRAGRFHDRVRHCCFEGGDSSAGRSGQLVTHGELQLS